MFWFILHLLPFSLAAFPCYTCVFKADVSSPDAASLLYFLVVLWPWVLHQVCTCLEWVCIRCQEGLSCTQKGSHLCHLSHLAGLCTCIRMYMLLSPCQRQTASILVALESCFRIRKCGGSTSLLFEGFSSTGSQESSWDLNEPDAGISTEYTEPVYHVHSMKI